MKSKQVREVLYRRISRAVKHGGLNLLDIPPHLRANITAKGLNEINQRYMDRYTAAARMERALVDVLNGEIDLVKIEAAIDEWRASL